MPALCHWSSFWPTCWAVGMAGIVFTGCGGPSAVRPPKISPSQAAATALSMFDKNADGKLDSGELAAAPGLAAAVPRADQDGDGALTADEIASRIEVWQKSQIGLMNFEFAVTLDGRPLQNADVELVPEEFLGSELKLARGGTGISGRGMVTIPKEQRPQTTTPPGVQLGFYQVRIKKEMNGKQLVPERYSTTLPLGIEVATDVPEIMNNRVKFELKSK